MEGGHCPAVAVAGPPTGGLSGGKGNATVFSFGAVAEVLVGLAPVADFRVSVGIGSRVAGCEVEDISEAFFHALGHCQLHD
jgi:hypothetical protein